MLLDPRLLIAEQVVKLLVKLASAALAKGKDVAVIERVVCYDCGAELPFELQPVGKSLFVAVDPKHYCAVHEEDVP